MAKLGKWSTTPGNNNSTPPDGWPEGQAPSTINDCARQMMADIRTAFSDLQYFDTDNTPSFLTATTFSLGAADTTNFKTGRRIKLYDATTLYGTIASVSSTFVAVRLDSGALTVSLSSCAIAVVDNSLPEIAYTGRNVIINGCMDVWQRGSSASVAGSSTKYLADRWLCYNGTSASLNMTRAERSADSGNVPTVLQAGMHLSNSLRLSVSAADTSIAAGEHLQIMYRVEGYDWRQIAHKTSMLTFWVKTNKTGTYAVSLRNQPVSASFVQNYTVTASDTWTRFAITVAEATTDVTWNYSESCGVLVGFTLASGSTYHGGAGNWTAAERIATSSQVNFASSAGNVFMLTGVQLYDGTQVLPLRQELYADEFHRCQRYYQILPMVTTNGGINTQVARTVVFPSAMRTVPSVAGATAAGAGSDISFYNISSYGFRYNHVSGTGATDFSVSADAEFSA